MNLFDAPAASARRAHIPATRELHIAVGELAERNPAVIASVGVTGPPAARSVARVVRPPFMFFVERATRMKTGEITKREPTVRSQVHA